MSRFISRVMSRQIYGILCPWYPTTKQVGDRVARVFVSKFQSGQNESTLLVEAHMAVHGAGYSPYGLSWSRRVVAKTSHPC